MVSKRSLRVPIASIPPEGLEKEMDLGEKYFSRWREEDPELEFSNAQINGSVRLEKHGRDILVRGALKGQLQLACGRCLEEFGGPVDVDFDLLLVPSPGSMQGEDEELSAADLDVDYYSGETVDLEPIIREQIILTVPLKPLCTEDCKGICPSCGAVLNLEACTCK
ncbi:MAG: YceD family protein [Desulfobaccales bacterium]